MKRTIFAAYLALLITSVTAFCLVWRSDGTDGPQPMPGLSGKPAACTQPIAQCGPHTGSAAHAGAGGSGGCAAGTGTPAGEVRRGGV